MVKIKAEEFRREWDNPAKAGMILRTHLTPEQIQEWIKHGKFSKVKEYCLQLPYIVKMCCLEATDYNYVGKDFGFVLESKEDARRLGTLFSTLREKRTCIEVEKISFEELKPDSVSFGWGSNISTEAQCPLVI